MLQNHIFKWSCSLFFNERTALHLAVENNNIDLIEILLQNEKIDINSKDENVSIFFTNDYFIQVHGKHQLIIQMMKK